MGQRVEKAKSFIKENKSELLTMGVATLVGAGLLGAYTFGIKQGTKTGVLGTIAWFDMNFEDLHLHRRLMETVEMHPEKLIVK